jgi:predicted short-subunit dehydrogenase-like oxidoreductase (DUF2520 family)
MNIVLIGTGNVAAALGPAFQKAGHQILEIVGRSAEKAKILAKALHCDWTSDWSKIKKADLYIVAISDNALLEPLHLNLPSGLVVHTAGAVSKEVLKPVAARYGVLYPLQSLKETTVLSGSFPFLIDATDEAGLRLLQELALSTGSLYKIANDEKRLQMHLSAVWVNNFPNLLYSIAYDLCREQELDFNLLIPLIRETALRLDGTDPWAWQTGPAIRNDQSTILRHQELMRNDQDRLQLYNALSEAIKLKSGDEAH